MLQIDGRYGEGGGQIVRTSLALSMVTQKPFRITSIRHGRKQPGLKHQHIHCIRALQQLSDAVVEGATLGSETLTFYPKPYVAKNITVDVRTAGSLTLLLQSLVIPALFAKKGHSIRLIGGTDTSWSMPIDYLRQVFLPHIQTYAKKIDCTLIRRGYYPKGGGVLEFSITPNQHFPVLEGIPIQLEEQGKLVQVKGVSHASASLQDKQVAERQASAAELTLRSLGVPISLDIHYDRTICAGSGITLWALYTNVHGEIDQKNPVILGADALGAPGKPAENVGVEAAEALLKEISSGAPVDSHLEDSLVPFLALFGGSMKIGHVTKHTTTNVFICNQFLEDCLVVEGNWIRHV